MTKCLFILSFSLYASLSFAGSVNFEDPNLIHTQSLNSITVDTQTPHHFQTNEKVVLESCELSKVDHMTEVNSVSGRICRINDGTELRVISFTFQPSSENPKIGTDTFTFVSGAGNSSCHFSLSGDNDPSRRFELGNGSCIYKKNASHQALSQKKRNGAVQPPAKTSK